ncbi:MAG: GAF domain-containing protein [Ktedonobacteraceae bacterium]|nr:GAF domain-containing protein [Ktedonobacteraceae bacterium]
MGEPQTWQQFLEGIVDDPQERLRIARAIGVNQITLVRWAAGTSSPRLRTLRLLLDALPDHHEQFIQLLAGDYPELLHEGLQEEDGLLQIPASFYARALEIYTGNPSLLRGSTLGITILQQMLDQLDPPQIGLGIFLTQCMPPSSGKVRSARMIIGQGSGIWKRIEGKVSFQGIESQVGHAIQEQRHILTQSREERKNWYPPYIPDMQSAVAFPVQMAGRVAGGVCLISVQAEFFSAERLDLLRRYAEMLVLAFEHDDFYPISQIELGVMPPFSAQQTTLATFQQRVKQRIVEATSKQQLLPRPQAEMEVWQELEHILLHLSSSSQTKQHDT